MPWPAILTDASTAHDYCQEIRIFRAGTKNNCAGPAYCFAMTNKGTFESEDIRPDWLGYNNR